MPAAQNDLKELLSEIAGRERRAFLRSWTYSVIALVIAVAWLSFTVIKTKDLGDRAALLRAQIAEKTVELDQKNKEIEEKKKQLEKLTAILGLSPDDLVALYDFGWETVRLSRAKSDPSLVRESFEAETARKQTLASGNQRSRSKITIQYFPKDVDKNKVSAALQELGFKLDARPPKVPGVPTNAIWFGTDVNPEDAKLVAYTLMRAGIQLKSFGRFNDSSGQYNGTPKVSLIQVGANAGLVNSRTLTVAEIRSATVFANGR